MIARDDTSKKCRVDQAKRIHHFSIDGGSAALDPPYARSGRRRSALIYSTGLHAYALGILTFSRATNKGRVRTAHADFQRGTKRVRDAHPTSVRIPSRGPMATGAKDGRNFSTGMPVEPLSMSFSGYASAEAKRHAAPGNAKKYNAKINYSGLLVWRCNKRNRVAFIASIDAKIGTIYSDDAVLRKKLAHSD